MGYEPHDKRTIAQINVTPFVDVMLVLLVIFMVTAPMMQQGIGVELPKVAAKPLDSDNEPLAVTIFPNGQLQLNHTSLTVDELSEQLVAIAKVRPDCKIALRADRNVPYGQIAEVMAAVRNAGVQKIGMVTEPLGDKR